MSKSNGVTINSMCFHVLTSNTFPSANEQAKCGIDVRTNNIIVFGQTGAGKSSLINMLASHTIAKVANTAAGCTGSNEHHAISDMEGNLFTFWDTAGLNEGEEGTVPARNALNNLFTLVGEHGANLVIYCVRGTRLPEMIRVNYDLFWGIICDGRVPIVLVATGLEQEVDMDDWWRKHEKVIDRMGMAFQGHACVTTKRGKDGIYETEYRQSTRKVWELVKEHLNPEPWRTSAGELAQQKIDEYVRRYNRHTGTERFVLSPHLHPPGPISRLLHGRQFGPTLQSRTRNVIVFGQVGAGKSSLINMLAGEDVAGVSNSAGGYTTCNQSYTVSSPNSDPNTGVTYTLWDTPGLNEGEEGNTPAMDAVQNLLSLMKARSANLLIYCVRGPRLPGIVRTNYDIFWRIICERKAPIVMVVTGLEGEHRMDDWWKENEKYIRRMNMSFKGYACVTTIRGRNGGYGEEYGQSATKVWNLVTKHCTPEAWTMTPGWDKKVPQKIDAYLKSSQRNTFFATLRRIGTFFYLGGS